MQLSKSLIYSLLLTSLLACSHKPTLELSSEVAPQRAVAQEDCRSSEQNLKLIYPKGPTAQVAPQVRFELAGDLLVAKVNVVMDPAKINAREHLGPKEYPFQFDVFEVFLRAVKTPTAPYPYAELEVSPYNENFQVLIDLKNGKKKFTDQMNFGIQTQTQITATGWTAEITIPLKNQHWQNRPEEIVGNAFVILGKGPEKTYWSLSLPPQTKPNFHQPQYFKPLVDCQP